MRRIELSLGCEKQNLLDCLRESGISLAAECGGHGFCGKCRVLFPEGEAPVPTAEDRHAFDENQLKTGWRLACGHRLCGDISLFVPDQGEEYTEVESQSVFMDKDMAGQTFSCSQSERKAIALDLGTTTLAARMVVAEKTGRTVTSVNRQRSFGADVISRIKAAGEGHSKELENLIRQDISSLVRQLGAEPGQIPIVVSANTTMGHLFQGYSCEGLGNVPYRTGDLSLHWNGSCLMLPGVSAFIGADVVSGVVASGMDRSGQISLLVDLGTNGEMVLGNKDRLLAASTAAGPAFEGGNISCGVPGIPGAVARLDFVQGRPVVGTIGDRPPAGICGSGVLEAVYELRNQGIIDETGLMAEEYFRDGFYVAGKVRLIQKDIREVQLAKAAIRAGIEILMEKYGIGQDRIDRVFLAGGFGQKLNPYKAEGIGLLPPGLAAKAETVGNSSLAGAVLAARTLTRSKQEATKIEGAGEDGKLDHFRQTAALIEEVPLAREKDFEDRYISCMGL